MQQIYGILPETIKCLFSLTTTPPPQIKLLSRNKMSRTLQLGERNEQMFQNEGTF
jgi:hypothetical protein